MGMMKEFKEFAMRGNVIDLAVGVVIGGAFGKIVSSFVADLIMPVLGLLVANVNFSKLAITLKPAVGDTPAVLFAYGRFLQNVLDFVIVAFVIFLFVKLVNNLRRRREAEVAAAPPPPPPPPPAQEVLLAEIRDLLKQQKQG
ncbi:large-conductance mechanosensitive channel protein MscL [Solimonas marina]|uniref:Large-conductance mechanosensitive channel n=1 Tax=Solimonas marina TaxID=2714601 RepID=A0A969W8W2_9GAMM|nr:large-conductance mechanosensitive channel protein MscL [Solimonas marina]NKF22049.1 large-conductance mechanosensitive channel protein MscL [Solimonas marina]